MTVYPSTYDSDLEIPRIDNNVSEISGDTINSLRDAIFAIQQVIGLDPQGNKNSLNDRVNISIDANGRIKSSSLEGLGLLTLPVLNRHIGATAGIEESKLELEYGTQTLKNLIDSMRTDLTGVSAGLASSISAFNLHVLGAGNFHDGYHIKINSGTSVGIAGLASVTVGDALNELGAILMSGNDTIDPHINTEIPTSIKHISEKISVNSSSFITIDRAATNVQSALTSIDEQYGALGIEHVDKFHANGILKEINSGTYYNSNQKLLDTIAGASYTGGTSIIKIPGVTSFSSLGIGPGDILDISVGTGVSDSGSYQIRAIGPLTSAETLGGLPVLAVDELAIFHIFSESKVVADNVSVTVYKPSASSSEFAPLACSVRNNETIVDTVSVLNPDAARAVSIGFNGAILNSDGYDVCVRVGIGTQLYRELTITDLQYERLGVNYPNPVSAGSVAERINAFVSDPDLGNHFPITAYRVGNELAIAHNWVGSNYTVEVLDGYTANYALGLDAYGADIIGNELIGSTPNTYSVNGYALSSLQTTFSGYASISSDSSSFALWNSSGQMINPLLYGIGPGSVMHVTDHPTPGTNGSYTLYTADSTSVSLFGAEEIDAPVSPTVFSVIFTASDISLNDLASAESEMGIIQILIDSNGKTHVHQRLTYGTNLGPAVEIVNVSSSFPVGDVSVLVGISGDFVDFNVISDSLAGETISVHEDFDGSFKLYHPNGIDYLVVKITYGSIPGGIEIITVNNIIPEDEAFLLCTGHFNGVLSVTNIVDNRLFGNISSNQIRDDFIELFSQRPISDLRADGVVRGFDLMDIPYTDLITGMKALPLSGGIAYVNGVRVSVETQKVIIQSHDSEGNIIVNARRVVGINDFGSLQVLSDELGEILTDGYNANAVFGKILPLYYVTISSGGISDVIDIRRFINSIDEKIEIIVDESNNVVGNFRSLEGALIYAGEYPGEERLIVKIINSVFPQSVLVVPNGVSIIGGQSFGGNKHRIINTLDHNDDFLTLMGNNKLENIEITSTTTGLQGALVAVNGSNISVDKCLLKFDSSISSNNQDIGIKINSYQNVRISNNRIDNVFTGIMSNFGCNNLEIFRNRITGISGVGQSYGIKIGTSATSVNNISVEDNIIHIDSTASTDIRAIFVDIGESIRSLNISRNEIFGELDINSENYLSNGIRITNVSATGNKIAQLVLLNNYIRNVKMHDSAVYGIFVEDTEHALISDNTLVNIAVYDIYGEVPTNAVNTACIWIGQDVDYVEINTNNISASDAFKGIYTDDTTTLVSIIGNILINIGTTDARYIYGVSHRANISDNKLVGPGNTGIWWKGERSKISDNHLSSSAPTTDYAFLTGIYVQASYVDVVDNTVVDMTQENSVGIVNASYSNEGMKILGNTVEGTKMSKLVELNGSYHTMSGNRLKNDVKSTTGDSVYVNLGSGTPDSISITGNTFEGAGSACIYSVNEVTNISITNNTIITTNLTISPFKLSHASVADCFVSGNKIPLKSTYTEENVIGQTPSYLVYNNNTIGTNRGMLDTRGIHASSGVSAYEQIPSDGYSGVSHWVFKDGGDYWQINRQASGDARYLYFPIINMPNGATLKSVEIQGKNESQAGDTFEAQIYKRSTQASGLTVTTVSSAKDLAAASGEFGNSSDSGLVDRDPDGSSEMSEIINYAESNYYIRVKHIKSDVLSPEDIRVYGITITFRY